MPRACLPTKNTSGALVFLVNPVRFLANSQVGELNCGPRAAEIIALPFNIV